MAFRIIKPRQVKRARGEQRVPLLVVLPFWSSRSKIQSMEADDARRGGGFASEAFDGTAERI